MSNNENQLFETLAIKHMGHLYCQAIRLARSAKAAEDLVQRTFASAYGVFEQFDKNGDFNNWLNEVLMFSYTNTQPYLLQPADHSQGRAIQVEI
jgi:DNA-directed RNA polymerase specialized sigma24 family protein